MAHQPFVNRRIKMPSTSPDFATSMTHYLSSDHRGFGFDNGTSPALTVRSGDIVVLQCREAYDGQVTPDATVTTVKELDWSRLHAVTGPVAVDGAEPGDILSAELLDFGHEGWGYTAIFPGFGLLADEFDDHELHIWPVSDDGWAELTPRVRVPVEPFCGVMGVAGSAPGLQRTLPPTRLGGNMDNRHLCKGSIVYFPVEVPQALLSVGDGHLAQGDGEVCGIAIEAPLTVMIRLSVLKGRSISSVECRLATDTTRKVRGMGYHVTTAAGQDLQEGARNAVRAMIDYLQAVRGLSRAEAYMLCSVAGDLKIAVPVLGPGHASNVTFHLPLGVFDYYTRGGARAARVKTTGPKA
jgi:acetamidase/formamidase